MESDFFCQTYCEDRCFCADAYYSLHTGELVDFCVKAVVSRKNGESLVFRTAPRASFVGLLQATGETLIFRGIVNFDIFGTEEKQYSPRSTAASEATIRPPMPSGSTSWRT